MANKIIGMPVLDIQFKYLGTTAVSRGERGQAILIVKEDKKGEPIVTFPTYNSFDDEAQETFSDENVRNIKDVLKMQPRELIVVRINEKGGLGVQEEGEEDNDLEVIDTVNKALKLVHIHADRNCWISIVDITKEESEELSLFVSEANKYDRKRFKALVYNYDADNMHVVNFTTEKVKFVDDEKMTDGIKLIPMLLGAIAGQELSSSLIARKFKDIEYVIEPEDLDEAVDDGKLFFFNDEGVVRIGRAVNSLTTITQGMTHEMKFILIVEVMDLIYSDIHFAWTETYLGKFKNDLDSQMLLISAINAYYRALANDLLLDRNFDNRVEVDVEKQRLANIPIYGEEEVSKWDDEKVMQMTVGTNVYLKSNIKILNTMEDLFLDIFL